MKEKIGVLFVCMGNICRSPTAQGVFESVVEARGLAHRIHVDSAGTHAYHVGEPPDGRAQAAALKRGIDISGQRARKVSTGDFDAYDYVLVMDRDNLSIMKQACPARHEERLALFMDYAEPRQAREVPDPYYGGKDGFEQVLDMVEAASRGLLSDIEKRHL